jgi:hypothetical protein
MPERDQLRFGTEGGTSRAYRVTLACGHSFRARTSPWREDARYACPSSQGCGYRLAWVSWSCGDVVRVNPRAAPDLPPGPPSL